jgi:folate-dependent phosphoribosylglycinamide formyltransferase PurN
MAKAKRWFALFSHTGQEIADLIDHFGFHPHRIYTHQFDKKVKDFPERIRQDLIFATKGDINLELLEHCQEGDLVTLHGYLGILPPEVCALVQKGVSILNGHPGLVTKYPELKGKDPQVRAYKALPAYDYHGVIIHEVVAEVDEGAIVAEAYVRAPEDLSLMELGTYTAMLRRVMFSLWKEVITHYATSTCKTDCTGYGCESTNGK